VTSLGQRQPEEVKVSQHGERAASPCASWIEPPMMRPLAPRLGADEACPGAQAQSCARLSFRLEAVGVVLTDDEPAVNGRRRRLR
jgi:hypothetical protein